MGGRSLLADAAAWKLPGDNAIYGTSRVAT